ncbi:hypothetical protein SNEBB_006716 [Seison nebaliae]|nr:hypothetical protein SNEBB_006716 [Seison nebaliae]
MEVIGQILEFAPPRPVEQGQRPSALLQKCVTSLEQLIQVLPGYQDALFMVSQVRFLSGDREGAKLLLAQTLERENGFVPAHVLLAQIHLASDDYAKVEQSLQDALSSNFHLKSHPLFMLIRTRVFKEQNRLTDAGQLIEQALSSAEVKKNGTSVIGGLPLREQDKADLYLELVDIRLLQKDFINAEEAVNHAVQRFKGTGEEARILIKNVDLTLSRGNTDVAINMLKRIQSNQTYYVDARERLARIYLEKKNDKNAYINTYLELDEQSSEPYTKILCGDAYMKIVQPGKAIKMYETALKKNPRDSLLAKKIGGALVKAHNYGKAISYYEVAIKIGHMDELRYDLANLFFKLDQLREADKVINTALEHDDPNITNLICQTKCLKLSSEIIGQKGNIEKQLMYMEKALQRQDRVIKKAQMMSSDQLPLYNQMAADLCKDIGILFERVRNFDSAIKMYKEAIVYSDMDSQAHLLLAKAYLAQNNLDRCRQVVYTLLKRDESNVEAKMLNANVQFRKGEADAALTDFQKILEKKSDNYIALQTLVVLMYHAGRIEDVSQFIATTEKMNPRCRDDAGFNYAHGLYHKLGCNPTEALINFNHCRQDKEYIRQAVVQMAQICLNRDNEIHASPADEERFTSKGKFDSNLLAQETAANLLASIDDKDNDIPYQVTRAYCLMHLKKADDTKQALVNLEELLEKHPNNVSIQVARSEALQHLNKNREALEILENLEQIQWNPTDADDIEKAWLKLAFQYFSDGDIEQCRKLCERVLEFNKCNTKAYEYLGQMMQQKKNYIEAAKYYEMAWKFGRKNQPQVGYSLALNYLQAERYTDCIDTCNYVSENHKDLRKKIQTEILTKARERLRT